MQRKTADCEKAEATKQQQQHPKHNRHLIVPSLSFG